MKLYMLVTRDALELPLIVADSAKELADKCGVSNRQILCCISKAQKSGGKSRFVRVEVGE